MAQLAALAGVHEATVSRALANSPLVAKETRERVQRLADENGYTLNLAASSLRSKVARTVSVAILLEHEPRQPLSDPFFLVLLGAIADALAARDHNLMLSKVESDADKWLRQAVRSDNIDGLIVVGQSFRHEALNAVCQTGVPLVVWGAKLRGQRYVTVGSDNENGGYMAARHLIGQGCRNIAFLGNTRLPEVAPRFAGYRRALKESRIARRSDLERLVHFDSTTARREVSNLLDARQPLDGVVASSDVIAMSVLQALSERGRRIPADVAVVGFDDVPLASHTSPPLSTIRQDIAGAGVLIVDKLMDLIAGKDVQSTVLPAELVVRKSTVRSVIDQV